MPPLPDTSAPPAPSIGLISLPSAQEAQQAASGGLADPFGSLVGVAAADTQDPTTEPPPVTEVLRLGDQTRAIVTISSGRGVICVGSVGRCGDDARLLLPTGWSVLSIDVAHDCIRQALNDPQDPFCIA